jgi:hypothetical protein
METSLTSVSGIGPAAAAVLVEHGFTSADQLAASVVEDLVKVPGFGPVRAAATLRSARSLVEGRAEAAARPGGKSAKPGKGKKVKKKTKDKAARPGGKSAKPGKGKKVKKKTKDKKKDKNKDKKKAGKNKKSVGGKGRKNGKRKKSGKRKKK